MRASTCCESRSKHRRNKLAVRRSPHHFAVCTSGTDNSAALQDRSHVRAQPSSMELSAHGAVISMEALRREQPAVQRPAVVQMMLEVFAKRGHGLVVAV